ncbi:pseudouridine synthase [Denitrovibrio acetiphilus DSM 12809]|uniref:Pseudouridine synthase n=1 Tax=Denitrovibrio acetiphilus (strain DSM 12809 / NBRC 114555 / N2460) TaxID=522772 RepID=D4H7Y9_DENA2|nr:pseudouridine synthase [Denitrovibrio acetiphilus]ADD68138.1 pseudouridine synthase [Denitrovibrio acetiphilus DSM 12809]
MTRINKYLAARSQLSRRDADKAIEEGRVRVNGKLPEGPWVQLSEKDKVTLDGNDISGAEDYFYWAFYKPKSVLTAYGDGHGKDTLEIYPFLREKKPAYSGRLDYDSEGLIIFSNDGDFIRRLQRAEEKVEKEYIVTVNRVLKKGEMDDLRKGIVYEGIRYRECIVEQHSHDRYQVVLHEGKKRQIRHMFRNFGIRVKKLKRVRIGSVNLNELQPGEFREFSPKEMREML